MQKYESYARTHLSGFLSVRSIITVFRMKLHHRVCGGESHDFPELVYVSSGPHTMKLDGTVHRLDQGQLMIYGPQAYHEGYEPSDAVLNIISFEAELPALFPFYNQIITLTQDQQSQISRIFSVSLRVAFRIMGPVMIFQLLSLILFYYYTRCFSTTKPDKCPALPINFSKDRQNRSLHYFPLPRRCRRLPAFLHR